MPTGLFGNFTNPKMSLQNIILILFFIFSLQTLVISSLSESDPLKPHQLPPSFPIPKPQPKENLQQGACSYTVRIKTSCSSPRYTRDYISISFGDVYRNEVYIPRLDNPASRAFERCSTDTFNVQGPCGYGLCYLYLRRQGYDGWIPESVVVYENNYGRSYTFRYGILLPNAVWYGFNHCPRFAAAANATDTISAM